MKFWIYFLTGKRKHTKMLYYIKCNNIEEMNQPVSYYKHNAIITNQNFVNFRN